MGVKSTQTLTRDHAERRYADLFVEVKAAKRRAKTEPMIAAAGYIHRPHMVDEETMLASFHRVDAGIREPGWREKAVARAARMDDKELEDELERLNDEANGGEGFDNYIIEG